MKNEQYSLDIAGLCGCICKNDPFILVRVWVIDEASGNEK